MNGFSAYHRPTWNHLLKTGLTLGPEHFTVSPRGLDWKFERHEHTAPVPVGMPVHKLRALYHSRRIHVLPEIAEMTRTKRMQVAAPVLIAEVQPVVPTVAETDAVPVFESGGYQPARRVRGRK